MALIECKECKREISDQADPCPQCGVADPNTPFELEKLLQERDKILEEEDYHQRIYTQCLDQFDGFPKALFFRKHNRSVSEKLNKHIRLAKELHQKALQKSNEINDFHMRRAK